MDLQTLDIEKLKKKSKEPIRNRDTFRRARKIIEILERDNFKCVECPNKENLTIDHINGRKFAKHDNSKKYSLGACQTLCVNCHLKKNRKVYKEKTTN